MPDSFTRPEVQSLGAKQDRPKSCFDEMSKTLQEFTKRISGVVDEIKTLQTQVFGATVSTDASTPPSSRPSTISDNIRDHMGDLERTITNLESVVARFR